jgi:hypothetical protein
MDTPSTFLFEVVFKDNSNDERRGSPTGERLVIVEVEPESVVKTATLKSPDETERRLAREMAPQLAIQAVQKDLPHGFEPSCSVTEIDQLPGDLHHRPPKFQGHRFRAWLP